MADPAMLTGWGRTAPTAATVHRVAPTDVSGLLRGAGRRGVVARGMGRSYGDAGQNAGGDVLVLDADARLVLDEQAGVVDVPAGVGLDRLMSELLPRGYFVPVTPGTRFVSVGGAIACDVHGKNHHVDGTFGTHVASMQLVDAHGELRTLTPDDALFWATVGGMGLTGVVVSARIRLKRVETSFMKVDTDRAGNLTELLSLMREGDDAYTYSVAWIDLLNGGRSLGRAVLTRGEHATLADLDGANREKPLANPTGLEISAPPWAPNGLMNRWSVRAFNELWFRKAPARRRAHVEHLRGFFYPLDAITDWNRLYGRRGFTQYQLVVPLEAEDALTEAVRLISASGQASFLAVLKRFGPENPGLLSFPIQGWTLALDLPAGLGLAKLFAALDHLVISAGGRVYLAKDGRVAPAALAQMYPRLEEFRAMRRAVDPDGVFQSDLSRRLGL